MMLPCLFIAPTAGMGRGVFTSENIKSKTVIEISPVLVLNKKEWDTVDKTMLHDYVFEWGPKIDHCCIGLGYVSLYNHAYKSNCEYEMDYDEKIISIKTMRTIKAGEELFINYNGVWNDTTPLWFEVK